jgi:hypothetical protein
MKITEKLSRAGRWALLALCMAVSSTAGFGQIGGGTISGYVFDVSRAVIPGAQVYARNVETGVSTSAVTNKDGFYEFPLLPPGQYVIEANHTGFAKAKSEQFALYTGTHPQVNMVLPVASSVRKVQVTAAAPLLNTQTTDLGEVVNTNKVTQLPLNGRNWLSLVNLEAGGQNAPSNSTGSGRGGMWFNGSPAYGNQLLVDGVDFSIGELSSPPTDQSMGAGNSVMGGISLGAIDEVKVDSGSFSAEYGGAVGGVVNIITKSGTNQYHGDAYEYVQNNALDANNFFANRSGIAKPTQRQNQFGGDIGGPIKKDKLFFFLNYEGVRETSYAEESGYVPTPLMLSQINNPALVANLEQFPAPNTPASATSPLMGYNIHFASVPDTENDSLAKLDYDFGKQHLAVRYMNNWSNYIAPTITPDDVQLAPFHYNNLSAEYTVPFSPTTLNEFRFGYARINLDRKNSTLNQFGGFVLINSPSTSTGFQSEIHYHDTPYTIVDNFTTIRGAHTFETGLQIMDRDSHRFQDTGLETYYQTPADAIAGNVLQLLINFPANKTLDEWTYALFGQDNWRLSKTLQLNMGLRWEHYTPLEGMWNINTTNPFGGYISALGDPMFASQWGDFGPRLGVAWSINPKTVVRAGGGISYMPTQPFMYYDFAAISPLLPSGMTITPADVPPGYSLTFPFPKTQFAAQAEANPNIVTQLGIIGGRNVADYNQKDYEEGQWNLSVQRALTKNLALQVSYVGNHAWHMYFNLDDNMFLPGQSVRPRPAYGNVQYECPCGSSSYDALQVSLNEREFHGLVLGAYYTYGDDESFGQVNDTNNISSNNLQNPYNIANSYGPVDGFERQMFVLDHTYLLPTPGFAKTSSYGRAVLGGWSLDGIMGIHSGIPVNVLAGKDLVRNTRITGDRPDIVPRVNRYIGSTSGALQWLNPAAFDVNTPYNLHEFGDLSYNALLTPGGFSYDAGVHKAFSFGERVNLTFRAEAFNIFNHPVLGGLDGTVTDPKFGQLTSASAPRIFQLALDLKF